MKSLPELSHIWRSNTPPSAKSLTENNYLLRLDVSNDSGESGFFYDAVQWCPVERSYYIEPVEPTKNGRVIGTECFFTSRGLLSLRQALEEIGIFESRRIFEINMPTPDFQEQLKKIHPAFGVTITNSKEE